MSQGIITVSQAFKENFYDGAKALFAADTDTKNAQVDFGWPAAFLAADVISFGKQHSAQDPANLSSSNRSRNEELTLDVTISSFIAGDTDDLASSRRAFKLLGMLEYFVRITDTTLAGAVEYCFLDEIDTDGVTDKTFLARGRNVFIGATFKAHARISGRGTP